MNLSVSKAHKNIIRVMNLIHLAWVTVLAPVNSHCFFSNDLNFQNYWTELKMLLKKSLSLDKLMECEILDWILI